jgi:peptidyl-prolyl cis-trans isomerase SurA
MKKLYLLIALIIASLYLSHNSFAAVTLDRIAAVVNDDVIMLTNVQKQARRLKTQKIFSQLSNKALLKEAIEQLIMDSLQAQQAKKHGMAISDSALNLTMQGLAQQNQLTLEQFQEALKHEHINYQVFREQIRQRLLINELRKRQLQRNTKVTNQEIDDLIANQSATISKGIEYRLQHVLIPAPTGTALSDLLKAKDIANNTRASILSGKQSKLGSISNWIAANKLPASQLRSASLLEIGQISDVFQDHEGFHIIKLINKRGAKKIVINEYHARHILIKTSTEMNDNQARKKLLEIRNQILAGSDFSSLAKQYSEDNGSAISGGDLGWASADSYVPAFAKTIKKTPINTISQPFKSKFGWHILQVLDSKTIDKTEGMLRNQAKGLLNKNKAEKDYDHWLKQLRNDAFVEYRMQF